MGHQCNLAAKESGLECTCVNNDSFTVESVGVVDTVEWHVYYVAILFTMIEGVEQQMCIKFCVKLEHSYVETIGMIQKAPATGNWVTGSFIRTTRPFMHQVFCRAFGKTSIHPGDSSPTAKSPDLTS